MKLIKIVILVTISVFGFVLVSLLFRGRNSTTENVEVIQRNPNIKYILHWTSTDSAIYKYLGKGNETFYKRKCPAKNCYITPNRKLLENISAFDIIFFHGPELLSNENIDLPNQRTKNQGYIFSSMESSAYYPVSNTRYNGVFNFTWTYKLNSDVRFGYMIVIDKKGKVIGPNVDIPWIKMEDMSPINDTLKEKLKNKSLAVAWFVSNCNSLNKREQLAANITKELEKHNLTVDVYGSCGSKICPRSSMKTCLQKLQRDYYFYFAFENSMSEDYVTEKLLQSLQNYVVPIVFGGANYTRFMPEGIYLDAGKMAPVELANKIVETINDKNKYYDFFKWHNYYSYHHPSEMIETDPYCSFCKFINNINLSKTTVVENFYEWWNPGNLASRVVG